jgi:hypothetical protein
MFNIVWRSGEATDSERDLHVAVLNIDRVDLQDVGVYTCTVTNKLGQTSHDVVVAGNTDYCNIFITSVT